MLADRRPTSRLASLTVLFLLSAGSPAVSEESRAFFDAPVVVVDRQHQITHLLDLNGDGDADGIGWWTNDTESLAVSGFRNDGSGALAPHWTTTLTAPEVRTGISLVATGRVVPGNGTGFVLGIGDERVFRSAGNPATGAELWIYAPDRVDAVALADVDANGFDDLVLTSAGGIHLYLNAGGVLETVPSSGPARRTGAARQLVVVEATGDGVPDVALVQTDGVRSWVDVYPISAAGDLGEPRAFELPGVIHPMPAAGDVDGDGDADFVVFDMAEYRVLRRTGPDSFAVEDFVAGGPATKLADVDADGDLDGLCCGGGGGGGGGGGDPYPPGNDGLSIFRVSKNDGTGRFAGAFEIPGLGATHLAGAADVDLDGDVDLVAGRCVYYAHGPIEDPFRRIERYSVPADYYFPTVNEDADGDGDVDLDVGLGTMWLNRADGSFSAFGSGIPAPPEGTTFTGRSLCGDFDGDGFADLIVEQRNADGSFRAMRLLRSICGADFVDSGDAAPPGVSMAATIGQWVVDLDFDSDNDLVLVRRRVSSHPPAEVWINSGGGFFTLGSSYTDRFVEHVADFDADGVVDLLLRNYAGYFVYILRGLGDGSFAPEETVDYGGPRFAVADFDGDGDLDFVREHAGDARLLLNDGAAHFAIATSFPTPLNKANWIEHFFLPIDVNADGRIDIVESPGGEGKTPSLCQMWLLSPDRLEFTSAGFQVLKSRTAFDVDGDGDLDLRSDTYRADLADSVPDVIADHVIVNRSREMPDAGSVRQFGKGTAGKGGLVPRLGGVGPFRPGESREYRLKAGLGGADAFFAIGTTMQSVPTRGGTLFVDPIQVRRIRLRGEPGVAGAGEWTLAHGPARAALAGRTFVLQIVVRDVGGPQGFSFSNGLRVTFGR